MRDRREVDEVVVVEVEALEMGCKAREVRGQARQLARCEFEVGQLRARVVKEGWRDLVAREEEPLDLAQLPTGDGPGRRMGQYGSSWSSRIDANSQRRVPLGSSAEGLKLCPRPSGVNRLQLVVVGIQGPQLREGLHVQSSETVAADLQRLEPPEVDWRVKRLKAVVV